MIHYVQRSSNSDSFIVERKGIGHPEIYLFSCCHNQAIASPIRITNSTQTIKHSSPIPIELLPIIQLPKSPITTPPWLFFVGFLSHGNFTEFTEDYKIKTSVWSEAGEVD